MITMRRMAIGCAAVLLVGCNAIFGVGDLRIDGSGGSGGDGGATGTGGAGGSGATGVCEEGAERSCYEGPEGTEGVGTCQAGVERCIDGTWGACEGQTLPQPTDCSQPEDTDCNGLACGQLLWSRSYGSSGQEISLGLDVHDDGALLLGGMFGGDMDVGPLQLTTQNRDGFIAGLDSNGNELLAEAFSCTPGDATVAALSATPDGGVVLCGSFETPVELPGSVTLGPVQGLYDTYVARYDAQQQLLWWHHITGTASEFCSEIAATPDGGAILYGRYDVELEIGGDSYNSMGWNLYVARFGGDGAIDWVSEFGGNNEERARGLALVSDGVVVAGSHGSSFDAMGVQVPHNSGVDGFAVKLDMAGNGVWAHAFAGQNWDRTMAVAAAPNGDVVVAGYFEASIDIGGIGLVAAGGNNVEDIWVARFHANGEVQWANRYGDESDDRAMAVAVGPNGDAYVAGWFEDSLDLGDAVHVDAGGGRDAFLLRLDASGNTVWSRSFAISTPPQVSAFLHQDVRNVAIDPQGFVLFSATYGGDIGSPAMHSALGAAEIFVAKLAP